MQVMNLPTNRRLISTADAAKALGVSMARVRQLAALGADHGGLDAWHATPNCLVLDAAQVKKMARKGAKTGRPRGGYQAG